MTRQDSPRVTGKLESPRLPRLPNSIKLKTDLDFPRQNCLFVGAFCNVKQKIPVRLQNRPGVGCRQQMSVGQPSWVPSLSPTSTINKSNLLAIGRLLGKGARDD